MKLLAIGGCVLGLVFLPAVAAAPQNNKLPAEVTTILQKAEQFELLSLDPEPVEGAKNTFHDYKILGRTTIKKASVRKEVVAALLKGMKGKIEPADCFNPRHGIRATHAGSSVPLQARRARASKAGRSPSPTPTVSATYAARRAVCSGA